MYVYVCNCIIFEQLTSLQQSWLAKQLNAMDFDATTEEDDDASLYRLFSFALHVGMKFRKKRSPSFMFILQ